MHTQEKLTFRFADKPHCKLMLERAFAEHNAGSVELPATYYHPARGLKIFGLSHNRRYCWLPAYAGGKMRSGGKHDLMRVRAVITRNRGKWLAEMMPLVDG